MKDIHDVITHAKFGDDRLRGSGVVAGQISAFPIDFAGRPYNTLTLPCERVIMRDTSCGEQANLVESTMDSCSQLLWQSLLWQLWWLLDPCNIKTHTTRSIEKKHLIPLQYSPQTNPFVATPRVFLCVIRG